MVRKKLSLRPPGNDSPHDRPALTEEVAAALALLEAHGRRAGQALVDEAQAAIKAGDDDRVAFLDRVRVALSAIDQPSPTRPQ